MVKQKSFSLAVEKYGGLNKAAAALGVTRQAICYWRRGEKAPRLATALKIEKLLGFPIRAWSKKKT